MRLLDLFCGVGGASAGYFQEGFEVWGVDDRPQPRYPYKFIQADWEDVIELAKDFDAIHASPPCQRYSPATPTNRRGTHPDLVPDVVSVLERLRKPYVIENVPSAPLRRDLLLCGTMFGIRIARHRVFQTNFPIPQPQHNKHPLGLCQITGGGACNSPARPGIGGPRFKLDAAHSRAIMGMPWATKRELNEAIPPVYTAYIGKFLYGHVLLHGQ